MPAGRKSEYKPEYCGLVIELGTDGASVVEMAVTIGVTRQTLHNWTGVHPDFCQAMERAKELSQVWWERAGREGMTADKFNAAVWARMIGSRFADYQDRSKIEHSGPNGGPFVAAVLNVNPVRGRDSDLD